VDHHQPKQVSPLLGFTPRLPRKGEEPPMSEGAILGVYWTAIVVLSLASWVVWYIQGAHWV